VTANWSVQIHRTIKALNLHHTVLSLEPALNVDGVNAGPRDGNGYPKPETR